MKLFKYPVLVFENIIKQLEPISLVSLSFCSKKTRDRIKRVSFRIKSTWFANECENKRKRGYTFAVSFPPKRHLYVSFYAYPLIPKKYLKKFNARIGDVDFDCRYLIHNQECNRNDIYMGCIGYKKASVFFNYILDLVRVGITDIWIDLNKLVDTKQILSEPCFKSVQKTKLLGKSIPEENVAELYDYFEKPVLNTIVKSNIKSLSPTSKLLRSEILILEKSRFISIEHLLNFSGIYIEVIFSSLLEGDIVAFIKHWLDGNYPNLGGVVITIRMDMEFETEKILDEFNTKRWNPVEGAQKFVFKPPCGEEASIVREDCSNGHDLERSDGLMATLLFGEDDSEFNFFVWHTRFPV